MDFTRVSEVQEMAYTIVLVVGLVIIISLTFISRISTGKPVWRIGFYRIFGGSKLC